MVHLLRGEWKNVSSRMSLKQVLTHFRKQMTDWSQIQEWMKGILKEVYPHTLMFDFNAIGHLVESINRRYGSFSMVKGCSSLKTTLFELESQKPVRVRISDFYKKELSGGQKRIAFSEDISYLRSLGSINRH